MFTILQKIYVMEPDSSSPSAMTEARKVAELKENIARIMEQQLEGKVQKVDPATMKNAILAVDNKLKEISGNNIDMFVKKQLEVNGIGTEKIEPDIMKKALSLAVMDHARKFVLNDSKSHGQ